jgi:addiction module RelE/StbE family toxin
VKVRWTPGAEQDRTAIWDYLEARDPQTALRIDRLFSDAAAGLADFPLLGQGAGSVRHARTYPHRSYRLVYEVVDETVWILVLIHTARHGLRCAPP